MLMKYLELPRTIHILCLGSFVNRAGTFVIVFLTLYLQKELKLSETFATSTIGFFGLGSILAAMIGGHLADRIGRRVVMLGGLFGGALVLVVLSELRTPWMIAAGVFLFALLADMYRPASSAMMADVTEPAARPRAFALMYVAVNLGFAVGAGVGGEISRFGFRWLFWGDALTTSAYALMIAILIRETLPGRKRSAGPQTEIESRQDRHVPLAEAVRRICSDYVFVTFCVASLLVALVFMQGLSTFPLYVSELGFAPQIYGRIIAVNGVLIVVLQLPLTAWLDRFDRSHIMITGAVLTAIGFGLKAWAFSVPALVGAVVVWTLGEILMAAYASAIVADLSPPDLRARYMGALSMMHAVAIMLGAPIGGMILGSSRFGATWLWGGCFVVGMASAFLFTFVRRSLRVMPADTELPTASTTHGHGTHRPNGPTGTGASTGTPQERVL